MPLSPVAPCEPAHTCEVVACGYRCANGLWVIEARMTDRKGYPLQNDYRRVAAGGLFHDMSIRITGDDALLIHAVKACIDAAPHKICPSITVVLRLLRLPVACAGLCERDRIGQPPLRLL